MCAVEISSAREVQAFAAGSEVWIANLMGETRRVKLDAALSGSLARLDAESFASAARDAEALEHLEQPFFGDEIELDAHAVVRLRSA